MSVLPASSRAERVRRFLDDHGRKLLRYCGVSVVNVITGVGTLWIGLEVLGMDRVAANIMAWAVSTLPAYLLSRHWVWGQQRGNHSMKAEIAPFWILAVFGLVVSTTCVWLAGFLSTNSYFLIAVNIGAYGIVWVVKYVVMDRLMWATPGHAPLEVEAA